VRIAPERPANELLERLADHLGLDAASLTLRVPPGRVSLDQADDIGALDLRIGDELWLVPADQPPAPGAAGWEVAVVGGPLAGTRFPLPRGEHILGRSAAAGLRLADPAVSRAHLRLRAGGDTVVLLGGADRVATYLDGRPVGQGHRAEPGVPFEIGHSLLVVRRAPEARPRAARPSRGRLPFNRPPAGPPARPILEHDLPEPPAEPQRLRVPVAAVVAPLLVGAVLWLATRSVAGLLLALATPLMAVGPVLEDRLMGRWRRRRQRRSFHAELALSCEALARLRADEARALRASAPDAAELETRAALAMPELWERRPGRPGFLRLRVGWGDVESAVRVDQPAGGRPDLVGEAAAEAAATATLAAVPLTLELAEAGSVGLAGPCQAVDSLARWLVVQAAVLHSPRELTIAAFPPAAERDGEVDGWDWLRWLPHLRAAAAGDPVPQRDQRASELQRGLALELAERAAAADQAEPALLVLVHENAAVDRGLLAALLQPASGARLYVVWAGSERDLLPDGCRAVAELGETGLRLRLRRLDAGTEVVGVPDLVDASYADRVARALSGLEEVRTPPVTGCLPARVGLVRCLGVEPGEGLEAAVRSWWSAPAGDLAAPVGVGPQGVLTIDLREQGPHALVGGTSGSGKSEFLRAWVTSLAARHSPRRVSFLLVDFKGGTAFQDCARLPHVVGVVTDLAEHLLARVRQSLLAELKRREAAIAGAGCKEFIDFERLRPDQAPPVLVVVFDEFEQLLAEQPEFVTDAIVPIARLGRGLGVHLVLGTQRPQGSVPEAIRSNANVRVALRMLGEAQSQGVVEAPDAARIAPSARGRAYVRLSHLELVPVQVAYAGAREEGPTPAAVVEDLDAPAAVASGCQSEGRPAPGPTDFDRLVDAMRAVAAALGVAAPPRPWLAALPAVVRLGSLPRPEVAGPAQPAAVLGLVDEPRRQAQWPLVHSLPADGNLLVYGAAGSGKSTALRTLASSLASTHAPDRLRIYGLDFSNGALRPLEALPHVGAVAGPEEPERMTQLLRLLAAEAVQRRVTSRMRAPATWESAGLPAILLLVDEHASFRSVFERFDGGRYADLLDALVRDGRAVGVHCALSTSERRDLSGLLAAAIPRRLLLRVDGHDREALGLPAGVRLGPAPPPGRGFLDGLEVQVAVLADGTLAGERAAAAGLAARLAELHHGLEVPRVQALPDEVSAAALPAPLSPLRAVIGLGGDAVLPVAVDLRSDGHLAVCGPRGSGRTTALGALASSFGRATEPARLALMTGRRHSELTAAAAWWRAAAGPDACRDLAVAMTADLGGPGADALPVVVLVDDAELLLEGPVEAALRGLTRLGRDGPVRVVAALEVRSLRRYSEWLGDLRESRHALLLNPDVSADGEPFGCGPLPRPLRHWVPGRGFLLRAGHAIAVQVAR